MSSSSSLLEVVELPSGEIVLRRINGEGEPLVSVRFSEEAKIFLGEAFLEVGRAMINTGVQLVSQMYEQSNEDTSTKDSRILH